MDIKRSYVRACAGLPVVLVLLAIWGFLAKVKVNMGVMSIGLLVVVAMWVLIDRLTQGIHVEVRNTNSRSLFSKDKGSEGEEQEEPGAEVAADVLPTDNFDSFSYDGDDAR